MTQKTANYHDTGYKEIFSYPEMVQQLIEGFIPKEIAKLLDFTTLKQHSGYYVTPIFDTKAEDVVWSVKAHRSFTTRLSHRPLQRQPTVAS